VIWFFGGQKFSATGWRRSLHNSLFLAALIFGGMAAFGSSAQEYMQSPTETCKTELFDELDRLWKPRVRKIISEMKLSREAIADYEQLKTNLRNDTKHLGLFDANEKWVLVAGEVAQSIKTKANLIEDILAFIPADQAKNATKVSVEIFYGLLKEGRKRGRRYKQVKEALKMGVWKGVAYLVAQETVRLNPVTKTIYRLGENIETAVRMPEDRNKFVNEMDRQLAQLDRWKAKAEKRLQDAEEKTEQYYQLRAAIKRFCNGNSDAMATETDNETKPESNNDPQDRSTATTPTVNQNNANEKEAAQEREDQLDRAFDEDFGKQQNANRRLEQSSPSGGQSDSDAAAEFLGTLMQGLTGGQSTRRGKVGGNGQCAQILARIQQSRNWLSANGSINASATAQVRSALNQNVALYNSRCR
jgi:hypothetical protein